MLVWNLGTARTAEKIQVLRLQILLVRCTKNDRTRRASLTQVILASDRASPDVWQALSETRSAYRTAQRQKSKAAAARNLVGQYLA